MIMNSIQKVLVVDDEPNNYDVIEAFLLREGYELSYASSGRAALDQIDLFRPDVILLDVMMPGMDGLEVCRQLKADPQWKHIPVILVTALNAKEDLARGLEAGADDFIAKPVNGLELRARVRSMLRIKSQFDSLAANAVMREDLTNMIVHDLRNPLGVIVGFGGMLLNQKELSERSLRYATNVITAADRLNSMSNDLLTMAKVEAGQLVLAESNADLAEIGSKSLAGFDSIAASKELRLESDLPPLGRLFAVDVNLIYRLIDNLLNNAIKFTYPRTCVRLTISYPADGKPRAVIQVADQGQGVPPQHREGIFEKFNIGELRRNGIQQTGLGLAFCKMVAEAHGGRVFVTDNAPKGALFVAEI